MGGWDLSGWVGHGGQGRRAGGGGQIRSDQIVVRPFPKNENQEKRQGVCTR